MKLSDADKLALYGQVLAGLCARPVWPEAMPKTRDGSRPVVNSQWHLATWARSITSAAIKVLEDNNGNGPSGQGGDYE